MTRQDRLLTFFGVECERDDPPQDIFPLGLAPFIRLRRGESSGNGVRIVEDGIFGLLPRFATEVAHGRRTYNARSETVATLPSFRDAWRAAQRCIVPAECIFEPSWETGKAMRWRISQAGDVPMGIAGIYASWQSPDGREMSTFAMLTVNADGHPLMQRFRRREDEKRMVVILHPDDYADWLACPVAEAARYFRQWMEPLDAAAEPLPSRAPASGSVRTTRAPRRDADPNGDLFG